MISYLFPCLLFVPTTKQQFLCFGEQQQVNILAGVCKRIPRCQSQPGKARDKVCLETMAEHTLTCHSKTQQLPDNTDDQRNLGF